MAGPQVRLVAEDAAGNRAEVSFIDQFFPKRYRNDRMELSESFMGKVVPEILAQSPEIQDKGNLLESYLEINRVLRQKNAAMLKDLAAKSRPEFLWNAPFISIPNGQVMAGFADHRTYYHQGREVDQQDHLGYDLAVTSQAPVPAANSGYVVLARYFGIYGNTVIIDHGYGVMSLYGHLASIGVAEGKRVARGEIVGNTGQTGLAGGDHLHYAVLLHGLPVNPVEWWDGHWIKDRISGKLGAAFRFEENPPIATGAGM
jgi:murein DD-endopeptidase MepM/ murein hydrolase activator NlpD